MAANIGTPQNFSEKRKGRKILAEGSPEEVYETPEQLFKRDVFYGQCHWESNIALQGCSRNK